jgi:TetR/AcrR family transcriptional regulator, cholesterol catabolism regulator
MDDTRPTAVGSTAAARPSPLPLTERQEARRRRILEASTALACGGGFDAVQMREVAETSEVALGTLYRYFPSKVHLLVAVMEDQLSRLHATLRERPPASAAPSERVAETLLRAFRALQREPLLADAMVRAMIFADRSVSAEVDTVSRLTTTIIVDAAGGTAAGPAGGPAGSARATAGAVADEGAGAVADGPRAGGEGLDASAVRVIEHTWHAALVAWLSGRATVAQVTEDIRTACRLLDTPA